MTRKDNLRKVQQKVKDKIKKLSKKLRIKKIVGAQPLMSLKYEKHAFAPVIKKQPFWGFISCKNISYILEKKQNKNKQNKNFFQKID